MNDFLFFLAENLIEIVGSFALLVLTIVGSNVLLKIKENKYLDNISKAVSELIQTAETTVQELQQTVVGELKKNSKNGKLTEEEIADLNQMVIDMTIAKLSQPVQNLLIGAKIDIQAYISSVAEAYVYGMHKWNI